MLGLEIKVDETHRLQSGQALQNLIRPALGLNAASWAWKERLQRSAKHLSLML